jgi:ABC-type branched-subunit amino acid transport system substrate-binding protein
MAMQTQTEEGTRKSRTPRARKNRDQQEAVANADPIKKGIAELVHLYKEHQEADQVLNDAIKAGAEASGLLASVVRKLVAARAGDNFQEKAREVGQLQFIFDAVGE